MLDQLVWFEVGLSRHLENLANLQLGGIHPRIQRDDFIVPSRLAKPIFGNADDDITILDGVHLGGSDRLRLRCRSNRGRGFGLGFLLDRRSRL